MTEVRSPALGVCSDRGMRRPVNEDSVAIPQANLPGQLLARKGHLYVVADGLGGHREGKTASDLAARTVMQEYYADPDTDVQQSLPRAIQAANKEVHRLAQTPGYEKMGTTVVAAVIRGNDLVIVHVGDSRAYRIRPGDTRPLTQDHTWVGEQLRAGVLTTEQAEGHEYRHVLTRSVGREEKVSVTVGQMSLHPGDKILLCSDGLWEQVNTEEMEAIVLSEEPEEAARSLVDLANERGGRDNISVVVIQPLSEVDSLPSQPALSQVKERVAGLAARFSAFPVHTRAVVGGAAAALVVAVIAWWVVSALFGQGSSAPPPRIAPIRYEVLAGDTRQAVADYFQVVSATLPADISAGQPLHLQPGKFVVLLSGRAGEIQTEDGSLSLEVSGAQRYLVRVDTQAGGTRTTAAAAPEKGNIVAVFGELLEDATVRAAVVDVASGSQWSNWVQTELSSDVWVYSAFHKYLLRAPNWAPELEGRAVLVRGRWDPGESATGFVWEQEDLFVLQEEEAVYASWLSAEGRPPLAEMLEPTRSATPEPSDEEATPTPEPGVALNILGEISEQGVFVRVVPGTDNTPLATLTLGTEVFVQCQTGGEMIQGTDTWYLVTHSGDQEGYVFAPLVNVTSSPGPEGIPVCLSE